MLFRNQELDRAFRFIAESDFDIFCLQEVPEHFLSRLESLPFYCATTIDAERMTLDGAVPIYLVILSRHPITRQSTVRFPEYWSQWPWRTRLFVRLMRPFYFTKIKNRRSFSADITVGDTTFHIFNLHLILAHPDLRFAEFEHAMVEHDRTRPSIICGDFNILESPKITILNWLLGGRMSDALFWTRERTHIEKRFVSHELSNPLRGTNTHPLSRSQLDHILVSHSLSITHAEVLPDRIGSDHHPIRINIAAELS